jgi:hypothetical protein
LAAGPAAPKVVICGTGRAGTTFLVQLLTELGLDTGFADREKYAGYYSEDAKAGLEINVLKAPESPYIVKDPRFVDYVEEAATCGRFRFEHVFIPVRNLDDAAMSRIRVNRGRGQIVPGGFWKTKHPHLQKQALAIGFFQLIERLTRLEIPFTTLAFPRCVQDGEYLHRQLRFLTQSISRDRFDAAFQTVSRPQLVHQFTDRDKAALEHPPIWKRALLRMQALLGR